MQVRRGVFLVAGMGTRMLPASKAIPKVMLPLLDRPLIQVVVEEAVAAGIEQIVLVTASGQEAIENHFDTLPWLEQALATQGKHDLLAAVRHATELATVVAVRQHTPRGLADAVLAAQPVVGDEPFMVFLPDDVVQSATPCARQLLDVAAQQNAGVIALERVPQADTSRYGIVTTEPLGNGLHRILDLVEKPSPEEAPSNLAIIGRYVLPAEVFPFIARTPPGLGGEIQLPDALRLLIAEQPLYGYEFTGRRFDCGHLLGYLEAIVATALAHPDLAPDVTSMLLQELGTVPQQGEDRT